MRARSAWLVVAAVATTTLMALGCGDDEPPPKPSMNALASTACGAALPPGAAPDDVPEELACTGLYADPVAKTLAPGVRPFAPAVSFWADGYEKDRFVLLPDGQPINAANMDDWRFPQGTKVWKEFRSGPRKIETRFFWKVSPDRWLQAAYVWSEDGKTATRNEGADVTVDGKPYHVPKTTECNDCHRGKKDKLLGFEAISLGQPAATGLNLAVLAAENRLQPPPPRTTVTVPDPAYAMLHVNCGVTCHNNTSGATAFSTELRMRLGFEEIATKPPQQWEVYATSVGREVKSLGWAGKTRVTPGAPEESLIIEVMKTRGEGQMPPIATKIVDAQAVATVEAWIRSLPK